MSERWKVAEISKCKACPHAAWTLNPDFDLKGMALEGTLGENRTRIYVGCNKIEPRRGFDTDQDIYGPETIPAWCPLPNTPQGPGENFSK